MPRPSSIDRLPGEIREAIGRLRQDGRTIDEILAKLRELDVDVSRSALGRHVQVLDKLGDRLRKSRALAEGLARGLGDKPADAVTRASIELLHDAVFELLQDAAMDDGEEGGEARKLVRNPLAAKQLSETLQRLVQASRSNVEFVAKIEARVAAAATAQAAEQAEVSARSAGLSAGRAAQIRREVLGLRPPATSQGAPT